MRTGSSAGAGAGAAGAGAGAGAAGAGDEAPVRSGRAPLSPARTAPAAAPRTPGRRRCSTIRVTITRRISTFRGAGEACATTCGSPAPSAGSAPARIWSASSATIAKNSPADPATTGNGPGFLIGSRLRGSGGSFAVGASAVRPLRCVRRRVGRRGLSHRRHRARGRARDPSRRRRPGLGRARSSSRFRRRGARSRRHRRGGARSRRHRRRGARSRRLRRGGGRSRRCARRRLRRWAPRHCGPGRMREPAPARCFGTRRRSGRAPSAEPPPLLCALSLRTTWIVRRIVLVRTSAVGVAVGWAAATVGRGGAVGRAIAAAATPPSAESTARAATAGVRRLMPTPSDPPPQATGSPRESFGKACAERGCVRELPVSESQETHPAIESSSSPPRPRPRPLPRPLSSSPPLSSLPEPLLSLPEPLLSSSTGWRGGPGDGRGGRTRRSRSGAVFGCGSGDGCGPRSVRPSGRTRASKSASEPGRDPR